MRKFIVLAILLSTMTINGNAQTEKYSLLLGGSATMSINTLNNSYLNLNPNVGLFVADRFCVGLSTSLVYQYSIYSGGISPFARYYFGTNKTTSFYLNGSVGLINLFDAMNTVSTEASSLSVGHVWFLNKSIGLETEIKASTDFVDVNLGLYLGFQIYFNKLKMI